MSIAENARARLDSLAKPPGSLGRLERLAIRLAETQGRVAPSAAPRRLVVFAGDHGVVAEGVGLWPDAVTTAMMRLMLEGRAGSAALARGAGAEMVLVDAGSKSAGLSGAAYRDWRVLRGTANLAHGPAMTLPEFDAALAVGARAAAEAADAGVRVLALGEMGIGNTTSAACLAALLAQAPPERVVGMGAGATSETLARKHAVVAEAVARARAIADPRAAIAEVAGFEISAIAGCIAEAARHGITTVLDGFITGAGALIAQALDPGALRSCIAAHRSAEPGHALVLERLGLEPFLEWELRLGEGTGALLLLPMLDAAAALLRDVATLAEVTGG
ncbi:nicotinate-nucleotide--dimethylbenzimidazole phosphoribosyltransferase [Roseococcus sp. SYP-B2431]|uniref:nicotinate-nucleotide--dimethylbenzimidazole phosphoribosyltransferase n=1 Tax=Roseococcus sp. SYP-B2431 TaxID=2496640 RepID=UPI00103D06AB|nr:nicotinate-nucleotide--dimethylbenzimidazole phosphoribosyltransferase [Roseococcus sp. SYP-B2431]TCH98182.1 nicotinate-nucleotide--dimethylbenzimidazole phosphoribosyltransferase [Roseococcus sp. SYP-B2431]